MDRHGRQWEPLEWRLEHRNGDRNPYDVEASATFRHATSGESITTGMFYVGEGQWAFRFNGTRPGVWTFNTNSTASGLDGASGNVEFESDYAAKGFVTHRRNRWAWSGTGEVFTPQLVMYDDPSVIYRDPSKLDRDIETFLVEHGFNGFHVPVFCRWLDLDQQSYEGIDSNDPNPDPRTFEVVEQIIAKTYAAGGMTHLWMWGDNDAGHRQTPMKASWGGKNGRVDRRLQRYLAARLGALPGWTMGYGFDLEHWVGEDDLRVWHDNLSGLLGWKHPLGGRAGNPKNGESLEPAFGGLDYIGYTHFRPTYADYRASLDANPDKPVFSEDRFRVRSPRFGYPEKDYDLDMTRRGLWHSTMARGVANIWGYLGEEKADGASLPYPNREQIRTYATFFESRSIIALEPNDAISNGVALSDAPLTQAVVYLEDSSELVLDVSGTKSRSRVISVDAMQPYKEIDLGRMNRDDTGSPYRADPIGRSPFTRFWADKLENRLPVLSYEDDVDFRRYN